MSEIDELSKVIAKFQKPLRLHEGDAKTILCRFAYLKQKLGATGTKGMPDVKLLLTSIYCYTRTPAYGRKIMGPYKFVSLCNKFEYSLTHRDLWRYQKLYFQNESYEPITNSTDYFEAAWYDISIELELPETAKGLVLSFLKEVQGLKGPRRAPRTVVGTAIYLVGKKIGRNFLQTELAEYFGISEVSLRNAVRDFESCVNATQF
jgi:hypothetical protein